MNTYTHGLVERFPFLGLSSRYPYFCVILKRLPLLSSDLRITRPKGAHMSWFINVIVYSMRYRFFMRERGPRSLREIPLCLVERAILPSIPLIILISLQYRKDVELSSGYRTSETIVIHDDS